MREIVLAGLLLSFASLCWGSNIVLGRAVHADIPPVGLSFWRWFIALLVVLALSWTHIRRDWTAVLRGWKQLLLLGFIGMAVFHTVLYLAVNSTTAINAALIIATTPVVVPLLAWALLGERPDLRTALGTAVSLAGVMIIVTQGRPDSVLVIGFNQGDLLMLIAVLAWSLYTVLVKRRPPGIHPSASLAVTIFFALVFVLPAYLAESIFVRPMPLTWEAAGTVAYVALAASVLAFLAFNRGIELIGPVRGGLFMHLIPVFATLLAVVFLGESLHGFHALGVAAILAGIWLVTARSRGPAGRQQESNT